MGKRIDSLHLGKIAVSLFGTQKFAGRHYTQFGNFLGDSIIRTWVVSVAEHAPGPVSLIEFVQSDTTPATHSCELSLIFKDGFVHKQHADRLCCNTGRNATAPQIPMLEYAKAH